ncbi:flagellar hook assembly protein FlgD [Enterovibrio norvegicus]|uniref:Basal-body rod modification protein FlgD n=2 Tax=Enterovibrio norvegicus TaxID=188144 RepID=A0A2N7L5W1_9GAMM|nr:flagellar hook assembly protein FlgD [Enterovibrio norvegicus]MCC4798963.1 flagellar hook assembly protein FlgD [Enterovibrio norvegicus]OEE61904.1 flagellar biosynthesis protein FlgD [Enterovibrio norvegicus]OEF58902.1 flagellar biosynthesis protein FlgD [Enterovibrio norvegicus]OEF59527.1 flagellar biosynthesis protein FlgD [Enterovibrio norvegicus]PMH63167.1 flagellar biosynthesis protein FlgD [Enterovibrio norvegicus]
MNPIDGAGGAGGGSYIDQLKALQEKQRTERGDTGEKVTGQTDLNQEDFLSLLTKQLANQDPFKPVDNEQMIAQMASFATVDGIGKMNEQFGSLNAAMTSSQALQASSLVGQDVLVPGNESFKAAAGGIAAMVKLPQAMNDVMVRIQNEQGQLLKNFSIGAKSPGDHRVEWDGLDDSGNPLPEGKYTMNVSGFVDGKSQDFELSTYANVNSVLLGNGDGNVMLNIAGYTSPVKLTEVLEVGNANVGGASKG